MQTSNLKPLTGLRFLAASWMVLYDCWPKLAHGGHVSFVEKGHLSVELFFVLSGFILSHVYLQSTGEGRFNYGRFLWTRLARIYPLHLATLAGLGVMGALATVVGLPVDKTVLAWISLPANLTLTQAWGLAPISGWNHASWSISAEWFAYLSFPLFAALAWPLRRRPIAAVAGALAFLVGLYAIFPRVAGFELDQATIAWGALRIVPCFAYGCAIYLLWRSNLVRKTSIAGGGALISGALIAVLAQAAAPDAATVALFGPLVLFLAALSSTGSKLGSDKVSVYLGEISFAMYMVVIPWSIFYVNVAARLIHAQDKQLPLVAWLGLVAGVPVLAIAAHHLIERPARELMRGWADASPRPLRQGVLNPAH